MFNDFAGTVIYNPGSEISRDMTVPNVSPYTEYFKGFEGWGNLNNGQLSNPTTMESVEMDSNVPISHTYSVIPWVDNTHRQLQPYMLVFATHYVNSKYQQLVNMAPIYKLNIEMQQHYYKYKNNLNPPEEMTTFQTYLKEYGEQGLEINLKPETPKITQFQQMAKSGDFMYLTKYGIMNKWNFLGVVSSKQESCAPNDELDYPEMIDSISSVGVVVGQTARVSNIWGQVKVGEKLFLVLTRKKDAKGNPAAFFLMPWKSWGDYPRFEYKDESGRMVRAGYYYIGQCTKNRENIPNQTFIDCALGSGTILTQDAYENYGALPCIEVQLLI